MKEKDQLLDINLPFQQHKVCGKNLQILIIVKTLSYVPEIIRKGSDWFKSIGTETTSGTAIVCLSGHIKFPGMYEIPMGMTIREVLEDVGGGIFKGKSIKVLQAGGPLNGLLGEEAFDTMIDFDAMSAAGASIGSGGDYCRK